MLSACLEIWCTERWCKGVSWYQVWLEYDKQSQSYCNYSRKTPICRHAHRVNRAWYEAETWYRGRLTIKPQTFCGLKEIKLKTIKNTVKNPTMCNNYAI